MTATEPKMDTDIDPTASLLRDRRRFLGLMGAGAATVALAACGGGDDDEDSSDTTTTAGEEESSTTATTEGEETTTTTEAGAETGPETDLAIAQLAAGLEVLAVQTYTAAGDAATSGALGEVPPAVVTYVTTAIEQHQQYLDSWNGIITGSGEAEVTEPNADLKPTVDGLLADVADPAAAAQLALMLEGIAQATYLDALGMLSDGEIIEQTGSIFYVGRQRMAVLNFVLGEYPVPDVFASADESVAG